MDSGSDGGPAGAGPEKPGGRKGKGIGQSLALALGVGFEVGASALLGALAGWWLDGKFGTSPWFLIGATLAGVGFGIYDALKTAFAMNGKKPEGMR